MLNAPLAIPVEEFDGYKLLRLIGRGRMGQVYLAHDTLLDRQVAVKFIASLQPDPKERERFFTEARAIARLQHPNVVTIHRVGDVGGRPYLISEFVRGEGLDAMRKPLESQLALRIGRGLARGLAVAHRQGVLHRDIKPANAILSEDGEAKLLDFGLAKLLDRARTPGPAAPVVVAALPLSGGVAETLDPVVGAGETLSSAPKPETTASSPGAVMGTPLYIAPEVWEGEPATFRADVYSLGALLYELCSGRPPHDEPTIAAVRQAALTRVVRPLAEICDIEPRFAAIIHRCLHRNPGERPASGEELRDALEQLGTDRRLVPVSDENPYQGLRAFQAKHRALFFGRDAVVRTLVERLRSENFLLVAGDSGVGKSSVCRAGVLPALEDGALEDGRTWCSATVVPGHRPLASLAAALAPLAGRDEAALARSLADDAGEVARDLRRTMGSGRGLVLFVDQLEELVTLSDPAQAADASRALSWLAEAGAGLRVIATLRTDFLSRLAAFPGLGDGLARALYLVRPMTPEAIREAIVGPALALGVRFESEALVATLVDSTARTEGGLPLAQFTLAALWEGREREARTIRASALAALGGVAGALSRHADTVIDGLVPEQRDEARRIFLELVTPERTRGRRTEEELASQGPAAKAALDALVRGRLLVATGGSAYEVAHEALIQGWPALRRWLDETVDQRQVRARLAASVAEWERLGRIRELLWRAPQLAETARLDLDELPPREARFIESSRQGVLRGRLVRAGAAVAVGAAVALIAGGIWVRARREMNAQVDARGNAGRALLARARDKAAERDRLRKQAFALFDSGEAVQGERVWAASLQAQSDSDHQYVQAGQELETALSLDAGRPELRRMLALVLFERATAAEQAGQLRDELVHRLILYDDGSLRERWEQQGQLAFSGAPQGATLTLERLETGHTEKLIDAAEVPVKPLALDPGSYLLIFRAPGRTEVRNPILLARGEVLSVPVELPPAARVPAGFVFVPAGRFLFGSAEESLRRGFLRTVPLHSKSTGAFLIARNETTFGDWIEFLRDLPPRERELRLPRVAKSGFTGALELKMLPGGTWQLKFQPASQAYSARAGELVVYQGRSSAAAQDWLRFPVSGISWDDARAYAAWLKSTGRVPSARLCDETEWERAARGADGREFPSGSDLLPGDANFDETYGRQPLSFGPDAVGSHPESRSPFGLDDMAGNAWEWTTSALASGQRVVRGGSFYHDRNSSRTSNREVPEQTMRDLTVGMRVCAGWQ